MRNVNEIRMRLYDNGYFIIAIVADGKPDRVFWVNEI